MGAYCRHGNLSGQPCGYCKQDEAKDARIAALEAALTELEAEPRYTVEEVLAVLAEWRTPGADPGERPTLSSLQLASIKRRLAAAKSTTAEEGK